MSNTGRDSDGNVYEKGWDGQYHQKHGVFGPERDTDWVGNPKVDRDVLGNPIQERDWLGNQQESAGGRPLFSRLGSVRTSNDWVNIFLLVLFLWLVVIFVGFWIIRQWVRLCIRYPKAMLPITGIVAAVVIVGIVTNQPDDASGQRSTNTFITSQATSTSSRNTIVARSTNTPTTRVTQAAGVQVTQLVVSSPNAGAEPQSTSSVSDQWVVVANTGGDGVYLRRTPRRTDTSVAWPDGTILEIVGPDAEGDGLRWKQVRDPRGEIGWVPTEFVIASGPTSPTPVTQPSPVMIDNGTDGFEPYDLVGAYRRDDGMLYGRAEIALYGAGSGYSDGSYAFTMQSEPTNRMVLHIVGIDDERPAKTAFQVLVNDRVIFDGDNHFPSPPTTDTGLGGEDRFWGSMDIDIPSGFLQVGVNRILLRNLTPWSGGLGVPYILINDLDVREADGGSGASNSGSMIGAFDPVELIGSYSRDDGMLYGRKEVALYGNGSGYNQGTYQFSVATRPSNDVVMHLIGIDDERDEHCAFRVFVNNRLIFDGRSQFPNAPDDDTGVGGADRYWGEMQIIVPSNALEIGKNTVTLQNVTQWSGSLGVPYILINDLDVYVSDD